MVSSLGLIFNYVLRFFHGSQWKTVASSQIITPDVLQTIGMAKCSPTSSVIIFKSLIDQFKSSPMPTLKNLINYFLIINLSRQFECCAFSAHPFSQLYFLRSHVFFLLHKKVIDIFWRVNSFVCLE